MNIRNVFKSIIIALSIVEVILVIVMVMTNKEEVKVVTNRPVAVEIVVGKPHGVVDILNEKNILTPIEVLGLVVGPVVNARNCLYCVTPKPGTI